MQKQETSSERHLIRKDENLEQPPKYFNELSPTDQMLFAKEVALREEKNHKRIREESLIMQLLDILLSSSGLLGIFFGTIYLIDYLIPFLNLKKSLESISPVILVLILVSVGSRILVLYLDFLISDLRLLKAKILFTEIFSRNK